MCCVFLCIFSYLHMYFDMSLRCSSEWNVFSFAFIDIVQPFLPQHLGKGANDVVKRWVDAANAVSTSENPMVEVSMSSCVLFSHEDYTYVFFIFHEYFNCIFWKICGTPWVRTRALRTRQNSNQMRRPFHHHTSRHGTWGRDRLRNTECNTS